MGVCVCGGGAKVRVHITKPNSNNSRYVSAGARESYEKILKTDNEFITSVGLEMSEEDQNLPYLYWTITIQASIYSWLQQVYT